MTEMARPTAVPLPPLVELRRFIIGAFVFSWTLWAVALALPQTAQEMPVLLITIVGGFGPFLAAVVMLLRHATPAQRREVRRRMVDFRRITPGWWLILLGLGVAPAFLVRLAPLTHPARTSITLAAAATALISGLIPAVAEELGWRGYALDRIRGPRSPVYAGVALGAIWALWHLPLHLLEGWYNADVLGLRGFPIFAVWIVAQSVVMAIVYYATGHSILSAIVIHLLANATIGLLLLSATEFVVMAALWAAAALALGIGHRARDATVGALRTGPDSRHLSGRRHVAAR